jgi:hypothetical protein
MESLVYLLGLVVVVSGLAWIATLAGVAQTYVLAGAAIFFFGALCATLLRGRSAA